MSTQGMTVEESNDFMGIEPRLVDLVKAAVVGLSPAVHVLTTADLQGVTEKGQHTPAIHLVYGGYRVTEDLRTSVRLTHTWYVIAAVRNVSATRSGQAARMSAGRLGAHVVSKLLGASVAGAATPLTLASPPPARYSGGFQYIPSAFLVETIFRKPE